RRKFIRSHGCDTRNEVRVHTSLWRAILTPYSRMGSQLPSWRSRRRATGIHTTVIAAGQATATMSGCAATHEVAGPVGFANSSRTAITVADNGFHSANLASHPGMSEVETTVSATMANGKTSEKYFIADSGLLTTSPNTMPTHDRAKRSSNNKAIAATPAPRPPCHFHPNIVPNVIRIASS